MCVLEAIAVLKSVAEHPVQADMREPDEAECYGEGCVLPPADGDEHPRQRRDVGEVVAACPDLGPGEVASQEKSGNRNVSGRSHQDRPVVV